jgi:Virulence factor BrkB
MWRITRRVLSKSLDDAIFGQSAQAAFFSVLSLPPLLLALLGSLAYIAPLFGPNTLPAIEERMVSMAHSFLSPSVVDEIIKPTIAVIDKGARREVLSLGFLISLVAGSSAILSYVDAVVRAHGQARLRHPLRQQLFALLLYLVVLVFVIVAAPLVALGPRKNRRIHPGRLARAAGLRLLPGVGRRPVDRGDDPVPGGAAQTAAVPSADLGLDARDGGLRNRHHRPARLLDLDHRHRVHVWRAGHADRVSAVRILRRFRHHAGRRAERRHTGRVAGVSQRSRSIAQPAAVPHSHRQAGVMRSPATREVSVPQDPMH